MRQTTITVLLAAVSLGACTTVTEGVKRVTGRSAAVTAPVCQNFAFPLYFRTGSEQLTPEGLQVIDNYSARVRACPVASLNVTGLADAEGGPAANMELSQRRAASVAQILSARGYPTPTFEVAAQGAAGATTATGRTEPLRRRAEVSVRFATAQPAP